LIKMSLLLEAGTIDNDNVVVDQPSKNTCKPRKRRSMLYEVWKGDKRIAARSKDSTWYLMYINYPMLNIPKLHV
jgi:hypothetical protein